MYIIKEKLHLENISDIIINDFCGVELKCVEYLTDIHENQLLNYLKHARLWLKLIFKFWKDPQSLEEVEQTLKKKKIIKFEY